jgi:SAM-dependent methyltransferase
MPTPSDWWRNFFSGPAVELWLRVPTPEMTRTEVDFLEQLLQLKPGAKVLDVPCGGGRHALELAARGYHLTGVDLSSDFLKAAQSQSAKRKLNVEWKQREMTDLPWMSEFDAAYCFGNSFGYLDDAGNVAFLKSVAGVLKPGGRFALDTGAIAESIFPNFTERRWFQVGDILFLSQATYDPVRGRLDTEYTFLKDGRGDPQPASTRIYTYSELCGLLTAAGFCESQGFSSLNREPFRLGSQRLLLVATKE